MQGEKMMSAQKSNQLATSQTGSTGEQKQSSLTRRSATPNVPALLLDPLGIFDDDSFSLIRRMQREMNRVFSQAGLDFSGQGQDVLSTAWVPTTEIAYRDGKLEVSADLPGLTEKDVKVEINNDFLIIQGERKFEHEEGDGGVRFLRPQARHGGGDRRQRPGRRRPTRQGSRRAGGKGQGKRLPGR